MEYLILFGVFTVLMLIGTPIAFCLGISSLATVGYMGLPPLVVFQRLSAGISVFTLMAIPFFIFAGDLMVRGGIAARIVAYKRLGVDLILGGFLHFQEEIEYFGERVLPLVRELEAAEAPVGAV